MQSRKTVHKPRENINSNIVTNVKVSATTIYFSPKDIHCLNLGSIFFQ